MSKKDKVSEINASYIRGIVDATVSVWEEKNDAIPEHLELNFNVTETSNGVNIQMLWRNGVTDDNNNENEWSDNSFIVYSKDTIDSVVSDISSMLSDVV